MAAAAQDHTLPFWAEASPGQSRAPSLEARGTAKLESLNLVLALAEVSYPCGGPCGLGDRRVNCACPLLLAHLQQYCSFSLFYLISSSKSWEEVTGLWRLEMGDVPGICKCQKDRLIKGL